MAAIPALAQSVVDALTRWPMEAAALLVAVFLWQVGYVLHSLWRVSQGK